MAVVLGITGGLSVGKSEVGKILNGQGFPTMDLMDEIFKIISQDKEIIKTISEHKDGKYQKLIKTKSFIQLLQKLLDNIDDSQYFRGLLKDKLGILLQGFLVENKDKKLCAIISRHIFEDKLFVLCDYVATVSCDPKVAEQRFIASFESDHYTYVKVSRELIPNKTKETLAGFVIHNTSTFEHLEELVSNIIRLVT